MITKRLFLLQCFITDYITGYTAVPCTDQACGRYEFPCSHLVSILCKLYFCRRWLLMHVLRNIYKRCCRRICCFNRKRFVTHINKQIVFNVVCTSYLLKICFIILIMRIILNIVINIITKMIRHPIIIITTVIQISCILRAFIFQWIAIKFL